MITGFNTDVEYDGRTFHVQTEDKGRDNPMVESLVYVGGEILTSRRSSYADIAEAGSFSEPDVQRRMEAQHQSLIHEIQSGRFDPEGPKPFGHNIITNQSLDEVVHEFLVREIGLERIRLEVEGQPVLQEGTTPTLRLRVIATSSDRPVAGAQVTVKLITTRDKPRDVFEGTTAADGRIEARFEIPSLTGANAAILCQAQASGNAAEHKQVVLKSGETSSQPA